MALPKGKLIASDQAVVSHTQHRTPCSDCPFRRDSLRGWLGGSQPSEFVAMAHSDMRYPCHLTRGKWAKRPQCAGLAIYRANVAKLPRDPEILRLPEYLSRGEWAAFLFQTTSDRIVRFREPDGEAITVLNGSHQISLFAAFRIIGDKMTDEEGREITILRRMEVLQG